MRVMIREETVHLVYKTDIEWQLFNISEDLFYRDDAMLPLDVNNDNNTLPVAEYLHVKSFLH